MYQSRLSMLTKIALLSMYFPVLIVYRQLIWVYCQHMFSLFLNLDKRCFCLVQLTYSIVLIRSLLKMSTSPCQDPLPKAKIFQPPDTILSGFYCGCGFFFQEQTDFKKHLLVEHEGFFVMESSHFVTAVSEDVRPCNNWDPSMLFLKKITVFKAGETQTNVKGASKQITLSSHFNVWSKKQSLQQKKDFQSSEGRNYCNVSSGQNQVMREFHKQSVEVKKEAQSLESRPLTLKQQARPQSLPLQSVRGWQVDEKITFGQYFFNAAFDLVAKKQNISQARLRSKKTFTISNNQTVQDPSTILGLHQFLSKEAIEVSRRTEYTFHCGCGKTITIANTRVRGAGAFQHIQLAHKYVVPTNSSHVFLRKKGKNGNACRILSDQGSDESQIWFCPCRDGVNMTRKELVSHVRQVHKGVSPIYDLDYYEGAKNQRT